MLFTAPVFLLVFLPVTLAGFLLLRSRPAWCVPWLLAASMLFYAWWSPIFLLVLVASTLVNWGLARAIEGARGQNLTSVIPDLGASREPGIHDRVSGREQITAQSWIPGSPAAPRNDGETAWDDVRAIHPAAPPPSPTLPRKGGGGPARAILVLGLAWNLGLLAYFKYADFFITTANQVAGTHWVLLNVVLPLGISFFTFQKIAYLVDVYRGAARAGRLLDFALFVFFFPQLIAGPIVHHAEVRPQLARLAQGAAHERNAVWENLAVGLTLLAMGLAKKLFVADTLALYATPVFEAAADGRTIGLLPAWQGALAYTGQLYFDFSGYSDMAVGLARMFGVRLPQNFASPYQATSIVEFWRRWHMTLSRFLRDYLYIPLGGGRQGAARRSLNLMTVMLLGGLWHGAGWTFVVWGGLHGLYLLVAHAWRGLSFPPLPTLIGWALTMLAVTVAWVVFRAADLPSAGAVLSGMLGLNGLAELPGAKRGTGLLLALAALAAAATLPNTQTILRAYHPVLEPIPEPTGRVARLLWQPHPALAAGAAAILVAAVLSGWSATEFLYFQF
ncbi:MAG TPA: MBOAT family protein [Beijerinckiaceae bacterium]|jgi:D-alanyl-lipoteichoic acid acyltransferase DltB (MBOAT superfamily)